MTFTAHKRTATLAKLRLYTFEDCYGPIIYTPQAEPTGNPDGMLRATFFPVAGETGEHIGILMTARWKHCFIAEMSLSRPIMQRCRNLATKMVL